MSFEKWYEEDAERLNKMAKMAHEKGYTVKVGNNLKPILVNKFGVEIKKKVKESISQIDKLLIILKGTSNKDN